MIDHVSIGVPDVAKAKRFYDAALKPLGYACLSEGEGSLGYGRDAVALWIGVAERPVPAYEKSCGWLPHCKGSVRVWRAWSGCSLVYGLLRGHDRWP